MKHRLYILTKDMKGVVLGAPENYRFNSTSEQWETDFEQPERYCFSDVNAQHYIKENMKHRLYIPSITGALAGAAYELHPYVNPPHISEITNHLKSALEAESEDGRYVEISRSEFFVKIKGIMMDCLEFRQLNISKCRWEHGQRDIADENEFWKFKSDDLRENDFIDLDALLQNMQRNFWVQFDQDQDCFLCKYAREYGSMEPSDCEECATCACNQRLKCNRIPHPWALLPRNSEEYRHLVETGQIVGMEL